MVLKQIILLGFGGHGHVVADLAKMIGFDLIGYVAPQAAPRQSDRDPPYLGDDAAVFEHDSNTTHLANAIGSVGNVDLRQRTFEMFSEKNYAFPALVHPKAIIAHDVTLCDGCQVMAGAVIQSGSQIGQNTIINSGAVVDHDCQIGDHVHIAPGAVLSGTVAVENGAHVGTGAVVIQGIRIGHDAIVGAGATVVDDLNSGLTVVGTPARAIG